MKQKFFYKISNKITFYFAILFSIIIAIIFLHFFFDIQDKEINHIKSQLNSIIKFSVPLIDGNYHSLISSANENDHYYNNISEVLRLVKDNNHKILDIYTVIFTNDDILIGVNIDESKNWGDAYQYKDLLPKDKFPIIGIPNSNSTDIFFGAETILFGVSPIYDNFGNLQAFLIIEFDTEQLQVNKKNNFSNNFTFFTFTFANCDLFVGIFCKKFNKTYK